LSLGAIVAIVVVVVLLLLVGVGVFLNMKKQKAKKAAVQGGTVQGGKEGRNEGGKGIMSLVGKLAKLGK
jgi:hypothetical protein